MAVRRKYDILAIIALVLLVMAYGSFRTQLRLQSAMPVEFFDRSSQPAPKRASEQKIALAYWNSAVKQVQWKYGYASRLPDDPPPEFTLSASELGPIANDEAVRRRYWMKLRAVWSVSKVWRNDYEWSSISFRQSLRSAGEWWGDVMRSVMGH